jgi:drug/metabolite transporter (DMT)-like permease
LFLMTRDGSIAAMPFRGILLCLASAAAFGAMGVFGKRAYDEGATVGTLLAVRFAVAGLVLGGAAVATGALRGLARRDVLLAAGLGAIAYSAQAGAYFAALARIDAGFLSLLVYTYPAIVAVAAAMLGRERAGRRTVAALALSSAGLVLVVAGAGAGALDPLGTALGLTAAGVYAAYVLVSEHVAQRLGPLALAALVCAGAAATLTLGAAATGELRPADVTPAGLGWLVAIALVSTVGALALFFTGLPLVGPTAASILSTAEPVTAVVLAFAVLGDTLGPVQLVGGALVLAAATLLTLARPQEQP